MKFVATIGIAANVKIHAHPPARRARNLLHHYDFFTASRCIPGPLQLRAAATANAAQPQQAEGGEGEGGRFRHMQDLEVVEHGIAR